jgi:cell division septation protein DedD
MPAASKDNDKDTEITLGTGKMLALFFALVALCGVFFAVGFSLGKNTAKSTNTDLSPLAPGASPAVRPQAAKPSSASPSSGLTFYKAVEQKDTDTQLSPKPSDVKIAGDAAVDAAAKPQPDDKSNPAGPGTPPPISGYYVQVAAVSKQEDAEALVDALKKKQYPAFGASVTGDNLFHVQVGPFSDIKEAEAMRAKLVSAGYNPILKK